MNKFGVKTGLIFASWAMMLVFGCHKKKPPIPPEEMPPTIISQIPIQPTDLPPVEQPATKEQQTATTKPPEKPAHTPPRHVRAHPPAPKKPPETEKPAATEESRNIPPPRVVIQEGGANASAGQASADSKDDGPNSQATTQQLLDSAANNLRSIKRQLSSDEQSMVAQINDYINLSKEATKDGDTVRAHNLARKARLLSDELVKAQ